VSESAQPVSLSQQPPPPPRPITPRSARRAWAEAYVRRWWMGALLLCVVTVYFVGTQLIRSLQDRRLIREGEAVDAVIVEANNETLTNKVWEPSVQALFKLEVQRPGAEPLVILSRLRNQDRALQVGDTVRLYIDRQDPSRWTDRGHVSFARDLALAVVTLPLAGLLMVVAVMGRRRALRVWRDGEAMVALVVEVRQAPSAPRSRHVRFTLRDGRDRRVFGTLVPVRAAPLAVGDAFWVVALPDRPQNAVVAALYQ